MTNVMAVFSNFLKASDLQGRAVIVTIDTVKIEKIGKDQETKPVLYFRGHEKGFVSNKTNAFAISQLYGEELEDWIGKQIELYPTTTEYGGQTVPAIRCRAPSQQPVATGQAAPIQPNAPAPVDTHPNAPGNGAPMDDEVPFAPHAVG